MTLFNKLEIIKHSEYSCDHIWC